MRVRFHQVAEGKEQALDALEALALRDRRELKRLGWPKLYEAGVRYRTSPAERRFWRTASQLLSSGFGDCADLAAWRVAELRHAGRAAKFAILSTSTPGLFHIAVKVGGRIEDPSRKLGMGAENGHANHRASSRRRAASVARQRRTRRTVKRP